jgi:hypothetical protein
MNRYQIGEWFLLLGWALFWQAGFLFSWSAWWASAGVAYLFLTVVLVAAAFHFLPMEEAGEGPRSGGHLGVRALRG